MSTDRSVSPRRASPVAVSQAPTLRIERLAYADPVVQRLVEEVQQEYVVRYGGPDGAPMEDTMFDPPTGAFFVAFLDDEPVATGAWRTKDDVEALVEALGGSRVAEIKRMDVRAGVRRTGVARAVLAHLEATAAEAGADVLVLETGLKQPEAIRLYESSGYVPVPPFGFYKGYPDARHLGKRLVRPAPEAAARP
jgi:GNAT superfamily N-acetyltransferase